jgi:hypothetical protein
MAVALFEVLGGFGLGDGGHVFGPT